MMVRRAASASSQPGAYQVVLTALGNDGWELTAPHPSEHRFFFKRPKIEQLGDKLMLPNERQLCE
jgi:hypothetical protein